jgi:hypothetical protein
VPDDRDPLDDIAHLDFDVEDPELAESLRSLEAPPAPDGADPRNWSPTEDVDDGTWVLNEADRLLQRQLEWRRHRRGLVFRVAASVVAIGLLALSVSALWTRGVGSDDGPRTTIDRDRLDFGPTSAEMANYLVADADVLAVDPELVAVPGNTEGTYDNLSLDELNADGVTSPSYGAEAGVQRRWEAPEGRALEVAIYLFADRGTAESARGQALASATGAGATRRELDGFALLTPPEGSSPSVAARTLGRFLITFEATGMADGAVRGLLEATAASSAAVH